jgi:poly(A) polymerase
MNKLNQIEKILHKWMAPVTEDLFPLYLVGGAVRDHLLNREIRDVDLACTEPEKTATLLGQHHDAAVVKFEKKQNAVCYRVVDRNNKKDFLDIVQLWNNSISQDLLRRDFTINSIAIQINKNGQINKIIDPLHGEKDLQNRRIRISASNAFQSDPLRTLRAFRFAAELDFSLDKMTEKMIIENASLISSISVERIMNEFLKICATNHAAQNIRLMDKMGLLEAVFPEIQKMKGCGQNAFHHLDVWDHSMLVLENCEQIISNLQHYFPETANQIRDSLTRNNRLALIKLSALLHDIGKPNTRIGKPDTREMCKKSKDVTFHGHDREGQKIISNLSRRLKMSTQDREFIESMVGNHLHVLFLSRADVKEKTILRWIRKLQDNFIPLVIITMADCKSILGPASNKKTLDHHLAWSRDMSKKYFIEIRQKFKQLNLINGNDLIALGMSPGPDFGQALNIIREAQDLGKIQNHHQGLALAKKIIKNYERF